MKKITYVTGNWAKVASAKKILETIGFEIDNIKMETIEIQDDNIENIAKYSAKWASEKLKTNILKNDSGLFIEALNEFPGPYTHYAEDTIKEDGILKLMENIKDRKAYFKEVLAYCEYGKEPVTFTGITPGKIAIKKSGTYGWSWDYIFVPDGATKTLGNFKDDERWNFWNLNCYLELAKYLDKKD